MNAETQTLASRLWPVGAQAQWARTSALAAGGALALTLSAKMQIMFYPVPMTLQTLVVLVIGAIYGAPLAVASVALYLAEGFVGLPVFAGSLAGPGYFMGPTGGFLAGFVAAAALVGALIARGGDRSVLRIVAVMAIGHVVIFAFGFAWLAALIGPTKAWASGVAPFYAATLVKTALAAALVGGLGRIVGAKTEDEA
jgi:biotin transport system substrate-specific component